MAFQNTLLAAHPCDAWVLPLSLAPNEDDNLGDPKE